MFRFGLAILLLVKFSLVNACENDCIESGSWAVGVALGHGEFENALYGGKHKQFNVLPSFYYYDDRFYIENTNLGYVFLENQSFSLKARGKLNLDGVAFSDSLLAEFLTAGAFGPGNFADPTLIDANEVKRDISYLAGPEINLFLHPNLAATFNVLQDITGVHDGYTIDAGLNVFVSYQSLKFQMELGTSYASKRLNNYYYGLRPEDNTALLEYEVGSSVNGFISAGISYRVSEHTSLVFKASQFLYGADITVSPLIERSTSLFWFAGFALEFGGN